jgi:hypothetical protein
MIFLSVVPAVICFALACIVLLALKNGHPNIQTVLEATTTRGIAMSILLVNLSSLGLLVFIGLFVPRSEVIYYNLIYVFVSFLAASLVSTFAGSFVVKILDYQVQWTSEADVSLLALVFLVAIVTCAYRIEVIRREDK